MKRLILAGLRTKDRHYGESPTSLLLLAHTRSGSTLLHHLLASHPEIIGCGERKATYASPRDLELLRASVHARQGQLLRRYRYVTDQINHNAYLTSAMLLNHPQVRTIFLVREPVSSIASMVHWPGGNGLITTDIAIAYYLDRLSALAGYAQGIWDRSQAFFLTYDDLITNTQGTLLGLGTFLGLRSALTERYQTFNFTGIRGDPSPNIQSGRVLQVRPQHRVELDSTELARLEEGYRNCLRNLRTHCLYSDTGLMFPDDPLMQRLPKSGQTTRPKIRRYEDIEQHIEELAKDEFGGKPIVCVEVVRHIVHLRRGLRCEQHWNGLKTLIGRYQGILLVELDTRWLLSICDTYADFGSPIERAAAMVITTLVNTMKLAESERMLLRDPRLDRTKIDTQQYPAWIFDGVTSYMVRVGDMPRNMFARIDQAVSPVQELHAIWRTILSRVQRSDNLLSRLAAYHSTHEFFTDFKKPGTP